LVEDFETHSCPGTPCGGIIDEDSCLAGWSTSHGSPRIGSSLAPAPPDEGNYLQLNSRSTFVDHHFGEGAFAAVDIQEGHQYRLSFTAYWEGDDNTTDVLRVSLAEGLAHNEPGSSDCLQEVGEADPTSSYAILTVAASDAGAGGNWHSYERTFCANADYSQLWLHNREGEGYPGPGATVYGAFYIDEVSLEATSASCDCYVPPGAVVIDATINASYQDWIPPSGNGLLPVSQAAGQAQALFIQGELEFDASNAVYFFASGSEIVFDAGAGLKVDSSFTLYIQGAHLQGCEELWHGIDVYGKLRLGGSKLEDAKYAVTLQQGAGFSAITGNTFNKNYVGLRIPPHSDSLHNAGQWWLANNTFESTGPLLPRYDNTVPLPQDGALAFAGIEAYDVGLLRFTGSGTTTFQDMSYGIRAFSSNLDIRNASFANIQPGKYPNSGMGIFSTGTADNTLLLKQTGFGNTLASPLSFDNCRVGIYALGINTDIRQNRMDDVERGVVVYAAYQRQIKMSDNRIKCFLHGAWLANNFQVRSLGITGNHITVSPAGQSNEGVGIGIWNTIASLSARCQLHLAENAIIHSGYSSGIALGYSSFINMAQDTVTVLAPDTLTNGIRVEGGRVNYIAYNTILGGDSGAMSDSISNGLSIRNSTGNFVYCDTLSGLYAGIRYDGQCQGHSRFFGNALHGHHHGLALSQTAVLDAQNNVSSRWWGSYSGKMAIHEGGQGVASRSQFRVHTDTLPYMPPPAELDPSQGWFFDDGAFTACSGTPVVPCAAAEGPATPGDIAIAEGELETPAHAGGMEWAAKRYLYHKLDNNQDLLEEDEALEDFYDTHREEDLGQLHAIEKDIQGAYALDAETLTAVGIVDSLIKTYILEVESADSSLETASSMDSILLLAQLEEAIENIHSQMGQGAQLWSGIKEMREEQFQELSDDNSAISPATLPGQNEQTVNSLFLNVFSQLNPEPAAAQLDSLEAIAGQCPLDGGNAVYFARGLLSGIKDTSFLDAALCQEETESRLAPEPGHVNYTLSREKLWLYPNPAGESLTLQYIGELPLNAELRIASTTGQLCLAQPLEGLNGSSLDISSLNQGIYYLYIVGQNGILALEKLAVIK
ncbi:MAG: T9SS type A sorting domain-containing protein, partial [Phaeodactylibacter sp.]|nr:T9SS type A sorting domain-containing protein [Phaeodactylibacter sp.]